MPDGELVTTALTSEKPLPLKVIGDIQYEFCMFWNDERHQGAFQAICFLCKDHAGQDVNYFINEKGHPSGYHPGWYVLKCINELAHMGCEVVESNYVIDFHMKMCCLATRGVPRTICLRSKVDLLRADVSRPITVQFAAIDRFHSGLVKAEMVLAINL